MLSPSLPWGSPTGMKGGFLAWPQSPAGFAYVGLMNGDNLHADALFSVLGDSEEVQRVPAGH